MSAAPIDVDGVIDTLRLLADALPDDGPGSAANSRRLCALLAIDNMERCRPTARDRAVAVLGELTLRRLMESPADAFVIIYRDADPAALDAIVAERLTTGAAR